MWSWLKSRRRAKLSAQPLSDDWRACLAANVDVYERLSEHERQRLEHVVKIVVAERPFVGLKGLFITEEVKITIAAQAALLLLGEAGYYFDRVRTIYVQPTLHRTRAAHDLGSAVLIEEDVLAEGQALEQGEIRLAWDEVLYGGTDAADGENVVLHEFAHHLDGLDGEIDGTPPLDTAQARERWAKVFQRELTTLRAELKRGDQTFLHAEAAENRAELFAYSTECFFEQPLELAEFHPDLFDCLQEFYKLDPRSWFGKTNETGGNGGNRG